MKLQYFAICLNYTILFVICLTGILVECNDLADMRVLIENIDFSSVKSNQPVPDNSIKKNDFKSELLYNKLAVHLSEFKFEFKQNYDNFTIIFGDASTSWIMAKKSPTSNLIDAYVSKDHGANYELVSLFSNSFLVNNLFINNFQPKQIVFTDVINNAISLSIDNGVSFQTFKTDFKPEYVHFTKNMNALIIFDETNKKIWISKDMAKTWQIISNNCVKMFSNNLLDDEMNYLYFIEQDVSSNKLVQFNFISFNKSHSISEFKAVLSEKIYDFVISNGFLFQITQSTSKNMLELKIARKGDNFRKALFEFSEFSIPKILKYDVVLVSKSEIFVSVTYETISNKVKTDLYVSKIGSFFSFKISLANFNGEIHTLNKNKDVFMANALQNGNVATLIKSSKNEWTETRFEANQENCRLNLKKNLVYANYEPISSFSTVIYPDSILASDLDHTGIYLSQDKGLEWHKILNENYFFTLTKNIDLNGVIIAVKKNEPTNAIIYSQDHGNSWNEYKFSNYFHFINKLLIEPGDTSSRVFLFCTKINRKSKVIFTFNFELDESGGQKSVEIDFDVKFEMKDLFEIETPNKIERTSFNIDFFLDFPYDLHLNSFIVEIVSYFENDTSLKNEKNFEITYLNKSEQLDNRKVETKYHKLIQTTETNIEVNNLTPGTEYHCYFYANLTSTKTNETRVLLLEKELIVKTQNFFLRNDDSKFKLIIYFILLIGILLSILVILILKRKQFANTNNHVSKYNMVDDNQLLIDKDDRNQSFVSQITERIIFM